MTTCESCRFCGPAVKDPTNINGPTNAACFLDPPKVFAIPVGGGPVAGSVQLKNISFRPMISPQDKACRGYEEIRS